MELTESEVSYLNSTNYIRNKKYRDVKAGKQTLNGSQALGYCRIRKQGTTINVDFVMIMDVPGDSEL